MHENCGYPANGRDLTQMGWVVPEKYAPSCPGETEQDFQKQSLDKGKEGRKEVAGGRGKAVGSLEAGKLGR
jgi:hypothetical protein